MASRKNVLEFLVLKATWLNRPKKSTLCRSKVWIGMKVLQANSIILSTRKLWWIFPIKQKFDTTASFLDNQTFSIWSSLVMFLTVFSKCKYLGCTIVKKHCQKYFQIWQVLNIFTIKKAAVLMNSVTRWFFETLEKQPCKQKTL